MDAGLRDTLRLFAWFAAFGSALWLGTQGTWQRERFARLICGLLLAAVAARAGFWWLHADAPGLAERLWSDPLTGYSALFVPAGPILAAPWLRRGAALRTHLEAAVSPLPLVLAVARLGCLFAGCCHGSDARSLPALEIAGLLCVSAAGPRVAPHRRAGFALVGVGGVRLATELLRVPPPLGPPRIPPAWLAAFWLLLGLGLVLRPPVPSSEQS